MRTRLVQYTPLGAKGPTLPGALATQVVTPLGELSTGSIHYPRTAVNATLLDGVAEVAVEYWTGTAWAEAPNCRFFTLNGNLDYLEDVPTRKYNLLSVGWLLRMAKVWSAGALPVDKDGKVQFNSAKAGAIMATLFTAAQARGWGPGLSIDFTSTTDSAGAAWSKVITIAFDLDLDLDQILSNLRDQGMVDYRWEGRTLRVFNPDGAMANDLTLGANPVSLTTANGATSAPEEWTNEDLLTDALVLGDAGKKWTFNNGSAGPLGRLEKVITQSGVTDDGTAALLAATDLLVGQQARMSYTSEFILTDATPVRPFVHYKVGDWVRVQRGTAFERLRVMSISLTADDSGVKGHAVLGDRIDDVLTKLAKRTKGITGGAATGGAGARPAPAGPDLRVPATPTGLVVQPDVYLDDDGAARGLVVIDWAHSGLATNGTSMTIDRYMVDYRENIVGKLWKSLGSASDTDLTYSPLPVFKADGVTAAQYEFRVRAIGNEGKTSAWTAGVVATMVKDTTPPYVPYFLSSNVTTWLRTVRITWNGKGTTTGSNQLAMQADFDHINVYSGTSGTMTGKTLVGAIFDTGELSIGPLTANTTVWYALASVDRSGNESALSPAFSVTPTVNVDITEVMNKVGAAGLADAAVTTIKLADLAVAQAKLEQQVQDNIALGVSASGSLPGINTSISTLQTSVSGKNKIVNSLSIASGTTGYVGGDRWQQWTSLSAGGKLIASWRYNGSAWIAELLDPTYLPLVDIGAGTFGSLDGGRMTAKSIIADALAIGDFTNLIPNAALQSGVLGWTTSNCTVAVVTAANGQPGLKLTKTSSTLEGTVYAQWVDVVPGEKIRLTFDTEGNWDSGNANIYVQKMTTAGTISSFNPGTTGDITVPGPGKTAIVTVPSDAVRVRFRPYVSATSTSGTYAIFSNMMARRMSGSTIIEPDSVTTTHVAANTMGAKQIIVGDFQNIAVGADFEDATAVPFVLNSLHTISTSQKKFGTSSLRLGPGTGVQSSLFTADTRVKEGEQWYVKFWAYIDATFNGTSGGSKLRVGDQASNHIISAPFDAGSLPARSSWQPVTMTVTVPAGDTSLNIQLQSDHTAGYAYIDDIQMRRVAEASLIQNLGVEKLVATSALIDSAVVTKFWAEVVNSQLITASMIAVSDFTNHIPDAGFLSPEMTALRSAQYSNGGSAVVNSSGDLALTSTSTGNSYFRPTGINQSAADYKKWLPVTPGDKFVFQANITLAAGQTGDMRITGRTKDGQATSTAFSTLNAFPALVNGVNTYVAEVPAGCYWMLPEIRFATVAGTATITANSLLLRRQQGGLLIVDGGIKAVKIDTNDLASDTGFIGSLKTTLLTADVVDTTQLKAGAITSKHTITGALFQTVSTASRGIKINAANGFRQYDSSGNLIVDIGGAAGANLMVGDVMTSRSGTAGVRLVNSSIWGLPAIVYSYAGAQGSTEASTFMRYAVAGDPEMVHRAPDRSLVGGTGLGFVRIEGDLVLSLGPNSRQGMRVEQPFNLDAWSPVDGYHAMTLNGKLVTVNATAGNVQLNASAYIQLPTTYSRTTGNAANVWITTDGGLFRSTSASKYKILPKVMELAPTLLDVEVKNWIDKAAAEEFNDFYAKPAPWTETDTNRFNAISLKRIPGVIAEDVLAAGGDDFIVYGEDGQIEGLMYDRLAVAQIKLLKAKHDALVRTVALQDDDIQELRSVLGELVDRCNNAGI